MSITERVVGVLAERLEVPVQTISTTEQFEAMGLDSLALVQLATVLEAEYGASVQDFELAEAGSVQNTVALLSAKGVTA